VTVASARCSRIQVATPCLDGGPRGHDAGPAQDGTPPASRAHCLGPDDSSWGTALGRWKSGTTANIHWKSDGEGKRNGGKLPHCEMVLFGSWSRASGNTSKVCKDKSTVFSRKQRASWAQAGQ
jgi:hypothetical protein